MSVINCDCDGVVDGDCDDFVKGDHCMRVFIFDEKNQVVFEISNSYSKNIENYLWGN